MAKVAGILGKKVGMTQLFDSRGEVRPATVLQAGPCVVKRHHFYGGPKSHGSMFQIPGSIGSSAFPSRVFKGMRMSGHMGTDRVTMRNLRILGVDKDENLLVVEGSVPGPNGGYLIINKAKKPPRERRGFAGAATIDPLKAAKRAAKKG